MMPPMSTATAAGSGQASAAIIPPSLQQLLRNMEASDNQNVSTNLARKAHFLIEAALDGSLCETKLGRRIPLAEALQRCGGEIVSAVNEYNRETSSVLRVLTMFGGDFDPATSKKVISQKLVENFIALDFTGFGIVEYEDIEMALVKLDGEPTCDEIYVINKFCKQMGKLLYTVSKIIGRDIAKDGTTTPPTTTKCSVAAVANRNVVVPGTTLSQAVTAGTPLSLQQLVRRMEASNDPRVSTDLVRYANALFDAAFNGSSKRLPLAEALQRCGGELISAVDEYNNKEIGTDMAHRVRQEDVEALIALDFTGFGILEYKSLCKVIEGPHKVEISIVKQFCERMSKLLCSVEQKIGHDIAKPPTNSDLF